MSLLEKSHEVIVFDNFSNCDFSIPDHVQKLGGKTLKFVEGDVRDFDKLFEVLKSEKPDVVLHFAGLKAVSESVKDPIEYYYVNVGGTVNLLKSMELIGCNKLIYSSSATVYGKLHYVPCDEKHPLCPTNPYGNSKMIGEVILADWAKVSAERKVVCLRYFNPVGAHRSGRIGEKLSGATSNIMPALLRVAGREQEFLTIFVMTIQQEMEQANAIIFTSMIWFMGI